MPYIIIVIRFPCLSWNITLLFPFRYPMKFASGVTHEP